MRYYVIADDGSRYGPAEIETLSSWISEGRLLPTTLLEEEGSGARIAASAVSGLNFPPPAAPTPGMPGAAAPGANPYAAPPGPQFYGTSPGYGADMGQSDITWSWVLGVIGIFCCGVILGPIGIVLANRAKNKGNPNATAPLVFNIVITVLHVLGLLFVLYYRMTHGFGTQPIPQPIQPSGSGTL